MIGVHEINPEDFGVTITLEMKLSWIDDRIQHPEWPPIIHVSPEFQNKIWTPSLYFYDLRKFEALKLFKTTQGGILIRKLAGNQTGMNIQLGLFHLTVF